MLSISNNPNPTPYKGCLSLMVLRPSQVGWGRGWFKNGWWLVLPVKVKVEDQMYSLEVFLDDRARGEGPELSRRNI